MGEITFRKFLLPFFFLTFFINFNLYAQPQILKEYEGLNVDYCRRDGSVSYNFYWPDGHISGSPFFGSTAGNNLSYVEFADGTAIISGTTVQGTCSADVYIVLKERKNWTDWQASGGSYKEMGCSNPDPTQMYYYVIDETQSYVTTSGGDCIEEGTYRVTQRPDPNDLSTPHLGAHIGVGGMLYDTNSQEEGLATWGWMGPENDLRRWIIDFNFIVKCIFNSEPPTCSIRGTDVDCYGDNDGTASVQVNGGIPPYSYSWDNNIQDTDGELEGLAPGTYKVTVKDSNGAETSCEVTIEGPDEELSCKVTKNNDVSINGGSDGSATVNATGGTTPYSYKWSNGETTKMVSNLPEGTHTVTVTDANGCETMCEVKIGEPGALSCEITGTDVDCYDDNDGTASVKVNGGVAPYSYSWDNNIQDTDGELEGLAPGTYKVTVKDSNGAETSCEVTIEGPDQELSCEVTKNNDVSINGGSDGSATVNATGGTTPYSYKWSNGETTKMVSNLPEGTHTVTVTDANGCETMCEVEIDEPDALSCEITGTDVDCYDDNDGTASVQVNGGVPPYSYSWDNNIQDTDGELEGLAPGTYKVTVKDSNGAETSCEVTIEGPDEELSCEATKIQDVTENGGSDGSATVEAEGGTSPYSYLWDNGETTQTATELDAGTHTVTVTDANGCETECEVEIEEPDVELPDGCETAFARYSENNTCFLDDDFNRWGWTNQITSQGVYEFQLYSAAGQCNLGNGVQSGTVDVVWSGNTVSVTINLSLGFTLTEAHLYIGSGKYPTLPNGNETVAPGKYDQVYTGLNVSDPDTFSFTDVDVTGLESFWIIVHGVTCFDDDNGLADKRQPVVKPYPTAFDSELNVEVQVAKDTSGMITIYGINGYVVKQIKDIQLSKGINTLRVNTSELQASMYFLEVRTADGGRVMNKVISK